LDAQKEDAEEAQDSVNISMAEMENSQMKALYKLTRLDSRGFEEDDQMGDGH
jgi:hypothetical protein